MTKNDTMEKAMQTTGYQGTPAAMQGADQPSFMTSDAARAVAEIKGAIMVAQNCPRDETRAFKKIMEACKRPVLAEQASYVYNRGGAPVEGPSIRLAETAARYWGNLQYGVREIRSTDTETMFESFCWDVESNVRVSRAFSQKHARHSKAKGMTALTDPRDVYEAVANSAARRLRACILEIIPGDVIDAAREQCDLTLKGKSDEPIADRVRKMVVLFSEHGVTEAMIEKRLGHKLDATGLQELVQIGKIYNSLRDGMSKREQWFPVDQVSNENLAKDLGALASAKTSQGGQVAPGASGAPVPLDKSQDPANMDPGGPMFDEFNDT